MHTIHTCTRTYTYIHKYIHTYLNVCLYTYIITKNISAVNQLIKTGKIKLWVNNQV